MARSKALECLQKRVLNIIFHGSKYMTDLIIANVETLSHDDSYTLTASLQTVISLGAWPLSPPPLDPPLAVTSNVYMPFSFGYISSLVRSGFWLIQ